MNCYLNKSVLLLFIISLYANATIAQSNKSDILGTWYNDEKTAKIKVYEKQGEYYGDIIWIDLNKAETSLDEKNPDSEKRNQPLVGLTILKDFIYDDGEYEDGTIYDPKNGKTYSCHMKLENKDKLYVRGYIGISLIGRTTYWTRAN